MGAAILVPLTVTVIPGKPAPAASVTLPETGVRFRLPLFRLVIDKNYPKNGRGVQPEVESFPTIDAVKRGADYKLEKAMEMIRVEKSEKITDINASKKK